jgi:heptosyltransferase-1
MRRILFVKTSSLGDVIHNFPAGTDAARAIPGAAIDWVVEEGFAQAARMHPSVRRIIPLPLRRWRRGLWRAAAWSDMAAFRRALRAERYDTVIDTQSLIKSALIASMACGEAHGMDRASARESLAAHFYDVVHEVPRGLHAVERNRLLAARALGFEAAGAARYGLESRSSAQAGRFAVFLTMTSRADKLWPEERWIELGRALSRPVVLPWGSEAEKARAQSISRQLEGSSVTERLDFGDLKKLFLDAAEVVGLDTGLTHLSAALGVRTVGIYCASDPSLNGLYASANAANAGSARRSPQAGEVLDCLRALG